MLVGRTHSVLFAVKRLSWLSLSRLIFFFRFFFPPLDPRYPRAFLCIHWFSYFSTKSSILHFTSFLCVYWFSHFRTKPLILRFTAFFVCLVIFRIFVPNRRFCDSQLFCVFSDFRTKSSILQFTVQRDAKG